MAHRLLQVLLPRGLTVEEDAELKKLPVLSRWQTATTEEPVVLNAVVEAGGAEPLSEWFKSRFGHDPEFRINVISLEATTTTAELPAAVEAEGPSGWVAKARWQRPIPKRISRDELLADILEATQLTRVYLMMSFISAMVAAGGLLRDNVAIVIGAMVIAPLLGPNVALCLATTLADPALGRQAIKANAAGVLVALLPSILLGCFVPVNPESTEILSRTTVGVADLAIAVASGAAGVLAFTSGASSAVIGVMVAVALMPPLVTFGLLLGSANYAMAGGALLLLGANVICVNLAGVVTFHLQGVRPTNWWEARRSLKATRISLSLWSILFVILLGIVLLSAKSQ